MKKLFLGTILTLISLIAVQNAIANNTIDNIKEKGVLVVGIKSDTPPFSFFDQKTNQQAGYDIDFALAIAQKLGVDLRLVPVTSADRIPKLQNGDIDIIIATMSKTPERAKEINFSYTYFFTSQKFLTKKGAVKKISDLENQKIGVIKGSTTGKNVEDTIPSAIFVTFDDYNQAFNALQKNEIFAVASDEPILFGLLAKNSTQKLSIPKFRISNESYGIGVRKNDQALLELINQTLLEMEKTGQAQAIFAKWFGTNTSMPMRRSFIIRPD